MMNSRKSQLVFGFFWSAVERFSLQGIKLLVSIILARLLEPEQFGIISMLSIFMALAQFLIDSGFSSALIQKKETTHEDYCSTFYLNIFIGLILTTALSLGAGAISRFYAEPQLNWITRFLSLNIFINSFGIVQTAKFSKEMQFKSLFRVSLISSLLSGVISVALAYFGFGVWSIAIQSVLTTFFHNLLLWVVNPWRPTLIFNFGIIRSLFSFGSKLMASDIIHTVFSNLYQTFIGKIYSARDLGFFARSTSMMDALINVTSGSLSRVIFPSFSSIQDDPEKLRLGYRRIVQMMTFFNLPMMVTLLITAEPLILFLMTEKWAGSIPIFKCLCVINFFYPWHLTNLSILKVTGRSDLYLKITWVKLAVKIIILLITFKYGIMVMLYGLIVNSVIDTFLNSLYSEDLIQYSLINQSVDILPSILKTAISGALMFLVGKLEFHSNFFQLLSQFFTGAVSYIFINWLTKSYELSEIISIIKTFIYKARRAV